MERGRGKIVSVLSLQGKLAQPESPSTPRVKVDEDLCQGHVLWLGPVGRAGERARTRLYRRQRYDPPERRGIEVRRVRAYPGGALGSKASSGRCCSSSRRPGVSSTATCSSGRRIDALISATVPLDQAVEAFALAADRRASKVPLELDAGHQS